MRPPICCICDQDFSPKEGGGLLYFVLSDAEKENNKQFSETGYTGHPEGCDWFCEKHYKQAEKLSSYTLPEVIKIIKLNSNDSLN